MIEIKAKLSRPPVYFANELITCLVTITNRSNSTTDVEQLAWSSAQLHCHLSVDDQKIRLPAKLTNSWTESRISLTSRDTSFDPCKGERGQLMFSTEPKILFCDLHLKANQSETFTFTESIPGAAPPSFNGSALKYVYKITIGTQRLNSVVQFLKLPLKIMLPPDSMGLYSKKNSISEVNGNCNTDHNQLSHDLSVSQQSAFRNEDRDSEDVFESHTSAPLSSSRNELREHILDVIMQKIDCLSAKRSPNTFIITNPNGKVAKFWILKSTFKLGEDVIGVFEFNDGDIPCMQFSVTLQSEEIIQDEHKARGKISPFITNYSKYDEFCLNTATTQVILPIPLTIPPTFETDIVKLSWKLHFEFVTTKPEEVGKIEIVDSQGIQFQCPKSVNVQTMIWDLPITILPTHPIQIGRGLQMPASSFILI